MLPTRIRACVPVLALAVFLFASLAIFDAAPALADELLVNGGFEADLMGWAGTATTSGTCEQRTGSRAANLAPGPSVRLEQRVPVAGGSGPYTLTGYASVPSGSANVKMRLIFLDADDQLITQPEVAPVLGTGYSQFSLGPFDAPPAAVTMVVHVEALLVTAPGTVCLDDLSVNGPAPTTPSAATPTTYVPTAVFPTSTRTPTPTRTARPATATRTATAARTATPASADAGPTETPSPVAVDAAPDIQDGLVNPGFEEGTKGWQKFGGDLQTTGSPVHGGAGAGKLKSATTATKWAYQIVAVEASGDYEFAGFLFSGEGISEAYLRISWYESDDGSGRALGTTDSTDRLRGASSAYAGLTTGPATAPDRVRSARLRVVLVPSGPAPGVLYLDDFSFGPAGSDEPRREASEASQETPDEPEAAAADDEAGDEPVTPPDMAPSALATAAATAPRPATTQPTVAPSPRRSTGATPSSTATLEPQAESAESVGGAPGRFIWVAAAAALFITGAGTYAYGRRGRG